MKKILHFVLAIFCVGFTIQTNAQETSRFEEQFDAIDNELNSWDPVRGKWLGSSLRAMSAGQPIPDRTFPEDFSPGEMMRMVPANTMNNVRVITQANGQNTNDILERERWSRVNNYLYRPDCDLTMGRTYGDPHLKSFDGESYSFQTVGEFVLTSANNGQLEVQVRQEPQSDDFSLNTAVAMNVGGDRVGVYAGNPGGNFRSPVLLNGFPLDLSDRTYYLPHGGTIRQSGKNYLVTWPTGEKVSIDLRRSGSMNFMNVAVQIYPCASYNYSGLLGNANGSRRDDYNLRDGGGIMGSFGGQMSDQMEKERLAFLAKDFANYFRVTPMSSLFDYQFGQNTMSFTDYTYPRIHRTINDLPRNQRDAARNACARSGLTGDELNACIFDQAYLQIPPTPRPVIEDRTTNTTLGRVDRETPNVNPPREIPPVQPNVVGGKEVPITRPVSNSSPQVREELLEKEVPASTPTSTKPAWESSESREVPVAPAPVEQPVQEKPVNTQKQDNQPANTGTPRPTSTPKPAVKVEQQKAEEPRAKPAPTPRPVVTPKPKEEVPAPRVEPVKVEPVKTKPTPKPARSITPKPTTPAPQPSTPTPSRGGSGG
jgi:hypothetical protein